MSKLDDLLGKKKEIIPVLDLSKTIVHSKEEYKRLLEKVPDYKMRPIKVRPEDLKIKDLESGQFSTPKKELKYLLRHNGERERPYVYLDPVPLEMRSITIMDLCPVPIDWKMLTTLRPKNKLEEDYYSKLIDLGKLQLKTELRDKREYMLNTGIRKVKNKSGVIETRVFTCPECSEEYCTGRTCMDFNYDLYTRVVPKPPQPNKAVGAGAGGDSNGKSGRGKKKIKAVKVDKRKGKKRHRSKSPQKKSAGDARK